MLLALLVPSAHAARAQPSLQPFGPPPQKCGNSTIGGSGCYASDSGPNMMDDAGNGNLFVSPHLVRIGQRVTMTVEGNDAPGWSEAAGLKMVRPCTGTSCAFKAVSATGGWVRYEMGFAWGAREQDYYGVVGGDRWVIDGTVTGPDDKGVAGIQVNISGLGSFRTERDGYFHAVTTSRGQHTVSIRGPYCVVGARGCTRQKVVRVPNGGNVRFSGKGVKIGGTVMATDCGETCTMTPVKDVDVSARGLSDASSHSTARTGEDGTWSMTVMPGSYHVTPTGGGRDYSPQSTDVEISAERTDIDFETCVHDGATRWSGLMRLRSTREARGPGGPLCRELIVEATTHEDPKLNQLPVKLKYRGEGWDPNGGPIVMKWEGKANKEFPAGRTFEWNLFATEWPNRKGRECFGRLSATQGSWTNQQTLSVPGIANVLFADNDKVLKAGDLLCQGEQYVLQSTGGMVVIRDPTGYIHAYWRGGRKQEGIRAGGTLCLPLEPKSRGVVTITTLRTGHIVTQRQRSC